VLRPEDLRVSRSLRKSARKFTLSYDLDFAGVIDACADPARPGAWIDTDIRTAFVRLHELGWAHSVETRDEDGNLVGGLYGIQIGRLFAGESMFHRARDASKAALMGLAEVQAGGLIDVQWSTNHLASLGVIAIDRWDYLKWIRDLVDQPPPEWPAPDRRSKHAGAGPSQG
jgi:leucyl/phenylalanyl-tRNA--protein transferase